MLSKHQAPNKVITSDLKRDRLCMEDIQYVYQTTHSHEGDTLLIVMGHSLHENTPVSHAVAFEFIGHFALH